MTRAAVPAQPAKDDGLPQLARRLQERAPGALEALIERTQSPCLRLAQSILRDEELSRDALQEAYFVAFQRIGQLRECSAIKSWLFRIVTNCCYDIVRRRKKEIETDEVEPVEVEPDLAEEVGSQDQLRAVFAMLPDIDRTALAMREVMSMSYEEMAQVLQIPVGTVRSRLANARRRFIEAYKGVKHD